MRRGPTDADTPPQLSGFTCWYGAETGLRSLFWSCDRCGDLLVTSELHMVSLVIRAVWFIGRHRRCRARF